MGVFLTVEGQKIQAHGQVLELFKERMKKRANLSLCEPVQQKLVELENLFWDMGDHDDCAMAIAYLPRDLDIIWEASFEQPALRPQIAQFTKWWTTTERTEPDKLSLLKQMIEGWHLHAEEQKEIKVIKAMEEALDYFCTLFHLEEEAA